MQINLLGVHINMVMVLEKLPLPVWFAQVLIAIFFTSGFVRHYQEVYEYAFDATHTKAWRYTARGLLMVMAIGVGFILHIMGYVVGSNSVMFHNVGLFLMLFPLLDTGITWWEVVIRIGGVLSVWLMHHALDFGRPEFFLSLVLLALGIAIMRRFRHQLRHTVWGSMAIFAYNGLVFWTLLPTFTAPGDRITIEFRAIAMFMAIAGAATLFWIRQHRAAVKNARLSQLANYDQLTNAKTYALYQADLTQLFEAARAADQPLSLVALDIDHFKQINDHYGHLAGNAILIGVATTLSDVLAKYGDAHHIYRTGGEEFNIVFPDMQPQAVLPIITACWNAVRKAHYHYEDFDVAVTLSMGLTQARPTDHSIDDTYKRADDNLYLSKRAGRDTITVEGETVHSKGAHDLIATYSYFTQGIMAVSDGTPERYRNELLLRLFDHEHDRWVLPDMFDISVETQINLMQKALAASSIRRIAINLTTAQFSDERVAEALTAFKNEQSGPDELTIEVTDVPDMLTMRQITAIYRAGGVRVDIDDVGSDNSFEVVHDLLPYVDGVKFAMQNLRKENSAQKMRERIEFWYQVSLDCHLAFILEGVENAEEVAYAQDLGIQLFQGYYFSKPALPAL
jgi:diguanylate cyclase (GGDEF)-like protein